MYSNDLYSKAFAFRDSEAWLDLLENDYFQLETSSGITYTCMLMGGGLGTHKALAMYPGQEGYRSLMDLAKADPETLVNDPFFMVSQDCIQCSIEKEQENVPEIDLKEQKIYAKKNGLKANSKVGYVSFVEYMPEYLPQELDKKKEGDLVEGLDAVAFLLEEMESRSLEDIGFLRETEMPFLKKNGDSFAIRMVPMRDVSKEKKTYPVGELDEFTAKTIKDHRKASSASMRVIYIPSPVEEKETGRLMFPVALLMIEHKMGMVYPILPECTYSKHPEEFVAGLKNAFDTLKCYPRYINVDDDRTESLLSDFSRKTGISLIRVNRLNDMDEVVEEFYASLDKPLTEEELSMFEDDEFYSDEELANLIGVICHMEDDEIRGLPLDLKQELLDLMKTPMLPEEIRKRLKSLL